MTVLQMSGAICLLLGAASSMFGLLRCRRKKCAFAAAAALQGRVIGYAKGGGNVFVSEASEGRRAFREEDNLFGGEAVAPRIEYVNPQGVTCTMQGSVASNPPKYAIGETVPLLYLDKVPSKAKVIIDRFADKWLLEAFLLGFGLLLVVVGLVLFLVKPGPV